MKTTLKKTISAAAVQLKKHTINQVILWLGSYRMKIGIQAAKAVHRHQAKTYLDVNNKNVRNYIVLLSLPVKDKHNRVRTKERLFWVNRFNFRRIKRKGWLPKGMQLNELRSKAFYTSDLKRSYSEEFTAKERATTKYLNYLKSIQE